jgi:hypothetical protein
MSYMGEKWSMRADELLVGDVLVNGRVVTGVEDQQARYDRALAELRKPRLTRPQAVAAAEELTSAAETLEFFGRKAVVLITKPLHVEGREEREECQGHEKKQLAQRVPR